MDKGDDSTFKIGGNHLQAAWILFAVAQYLAIQLPNKYIPTEPKALHDAILSTASDGIILETPHSISLTGETIVMNGKEIPIPVRHAQKPRSGPAGRGA